MVEATQEYPDFINLGIVSNARDEVLLIRRVKEEKGYEGETLRWAFPGGKQRKGESREDCVRREVLAETGYDVRPIQQISIRSHPQFPVIVVYHRCELNSEEPVAPPGQPHEVAEVRWVKPAEIFQLITTNLDPDVKRTLGLFGGGAGRGAAG